MKTPGFARERHAVYLTLDQQSVGGNCCIFLLYQLQCMDTDVRQDIYANSRSSVDTPLTIPTGDQNPGLTRDSG